jgi:hypothetical protein
MAADLAAASAVLRELLAGRPDYASALSRISRVTNTPESSLLASVPFKLMVKSAMSLIDLECSDRAMCWR